jgi:hypothetical protein
MTFALTSPEVLDEARLREHEADFTPTPVVRQCLEHAVRLSGWNGDPERVCDPAAGGGVWLREMARLWPCAYTLAIEKREEDRAHLERHATDVVIGDALSSESFCGPWPGVDLFATNPPFSLFRDYVDTLLCKGGDVWLFAPVDANVRGEEPSRWLDDSAFYVRRCLWVRGGIGFRGPGHSQDFRQYGLWMFESNPDHTSDPDGWPVTLLPWLPGSDRRWVTRPGTEVEQ